MVPLGNRWPLAKEQYLAWHRNREGFCLGNILACQVDEQTTVVHMLAQKGLVSRANPRPLQYRALGLCLQKLRCFAAGLRDASVHMPRIGCGLAGGSWEHVEVFVRTELVEHGLDVWVYDLPN